MVPRVAKRGHSFKGAGQYYLHDKKAQTSERVAWTHTHNVPTQDPEKAMKWMAYTAMNANYLKQQAGVPMTGRKAKAGSVYSFSLGWHPEQNPEKESMLHSAMETLENLGLKDHEAVIVCHQETDHPHVHVICNLVNPNNGKMAFPSYDFLTLSKWAQEHEVEHGKIYCEERVKNNARRKERSQDFDQNKIVKHREEKLKRAEEIQKLYNRSDSGKAFQAAMDEAGYTLAKGDRRGFVFVDRQGKISSLSRQLKGQRAKDIKARLSDLENLPNAKRVSVEIKRNEQKRKENQPGKNHVEEQQHKQNQQTKKSRSISQDRALKAKEAQKEKPIAKEKPSSISEPFYKEVDRIRERSQMEKQERRSLEEKMTSFYKRDEHIEKIKELEKQVKKHDSVIGRLTGKHEESKEKLNAEKKTLRNVDQRIGEYRSALETKIEERQKKQHSKNVSNEQKPEPNKEEIEKRKAELKAEIRNRSKGKQRGINFDR